MNNNTTATGSEDSPSRARLGFTAEKFANRTPVGELVARYEAGGWQAFGMTPEQADEFQENLDAVMARALAAQDGES